MAAPIPPLSAPSTVEAQPTKEHAATMEDAKPIESPAASAGPPLPPTTNISIVSGYRPGLIASTLQMHMDFYYPTEGWGREFEAGLSTGLGDFLKRLDRPVNQVWSAIVTVPAADAQSAPVERIVGTVYIDGECSGKEGAARLRFFIVDDSARGLGVGGKLIRAAMEFVKHSGFRDCHLSTLHSLTVARRMYEREGFREVGQVWSEQFGKGFMELKYVWHRPDEKLE
ncbi:uncharacterized protein B0T15DRAFT_35207 [Chaetomium strumarium]|uniref:N-acetyltransferase domain-containing protein n=1 Tax=Chaetomium strumarium TaxID=1170767 RepID=A0AAJ0H214_9PEZI|nr:hypothetical protein B0T15DRAFT_35207 [Chaetomium strumarium]